MTFYINGLHSCSQQDKSSKDKNKNVIGVVAYKMKRYL